MSQFGKKTSSGSNAPTLQTAGNHKMKTSRMIHSAGKHHACALVNEKGAEHLVFAGENAIGPVIFASTLGICKEEAMAARTAISSGSKNLEAKVKALVIAIGGHFKTAKTVKFAVYKQGGKAVKRNDGTTIVNPVK